MEAPDSLEWIEDELRVVRGKNLFRTLTEIASGQSPEILIGGKKHILLASNNYLGLSTDPRVVEAAARALSKYGTGSGGSRLVSGSSDLHAELEEKIAQFKSTEAAILFSSGYLANVGTIAALVGEGDTVFSDELNHASIIDGCRLSRADVKIYPHLDTDALRRMVSRSRGSGKKLVVTDTVFSMDGDLTDLGEICSISERHDCMLMVDEAHAMGVLGKKGSGATEHFGVERRVPVVMGTLSKAVGSLGGYVAGSRSLVDFIRNRVRSYIFDTSLPAASLAASIEAIGIIEGEPQRRKHLMDLVDKFKSGLCDMGFDVLPSQSAIVPVLTGEPEATLELASALRELGVYTPAVRPPSVPAGKCRIRASLMATHTEDHIAQALEGFRAASSLVSGSNT